LKFDLQKTFTLSPIKRVFELFHRILIILLGLMSSNLSAQDTTGFLTTSVNSMCLGDSALLSAGTVGANYGNGSDGPISVNSGIIYTDAVRTSVTGNNAANSNTITVSSSSGFSVGDEIMVITMVDAATSNNTVGLHDFNIISGISGNTLTLAAVHINTYNAASSRKHQVLKVPNYTSVTISAGATLTCNTWDGSTGGVLCFRANGTLTNSGTITSSGKGYRGVGHNAVWRNKNGAQGEGIYGTGYVGGNSNGSNSATWNGANGNGGGGGTGRQDSGGGAGGGDASNGTNGTNQGSHFGGTGGLSVGTANLELLIMGGAGGEGGGDEDGQKPGYGGDGGGIIYISASVTQNAGTITCNGQNGGNGTGGGCGMGGGGGGAGGSIKLISVFSGNGTITSLGGNGGTNNGCGGPGGAGSFGRIALASTSSSFPTTTPTSNTASLTVITGSSYLWNTGDTTSSIAVAPTTSTTYFVTITNGSWADTLSQEIYVFGTPNLPQINDQEHCSGTFTFSATTDSLVETVWYDVPSGGTPIHYGNQFTTPVLNDTTTYYVSSRYIPYTPPADEVDNAIQLALGLRLLDSDYQGKSVLLRKSAAANDTASFGFDSFGQVDLDSINAWAGSSSTLWVHTVYDQSGNGRNLIQTNTSRQPILLLSGENGKPVLRFTTGKFLRYTTNDIVYPMSFVTSAKLTSNSCGRVFGASNNYIFAFHSNQVNWHHFNTWVSNSSINKVSASSSDTWIHTSMSASNTSHRFFDNGDEWPANTINSANSQPPNGFQLNGYNGNNSTSNVDIMEVFIFSDTISDVEREYIEGRIASQYNWQTAGGQVADASAGCLLSNPNRDTVTAFVTEPSFGLSTDTVSVNCGQDSVLIDAGAGWNSYAWSNQDTTQVCKAKYSGEYTIVVNDGLCTLSDTVFVSIPNPELEDFTMCNGDTISAGYSSLGGYASGGTLGAVGTEALNIFLADGTLVLPSSTSVRALLVGGGGGGGMDMGGGGGAGGFIDSTFILPGGTYNISVGQGGSGAPAAGTNGQPTSHQYTIPAISGSNSSIGSAVAALGGGAGGSSVWGHTIQSSGYNGGSGGGCSGYGAPNSSGAGLGTTGQGNRGGHGGGSHRSGGGGGAGSQGGGGPNGGSYNANGGVGLQSDILGTTYYFAGGGGGSGYSTVGGNGGIGGGGGGAVGTTTGGAGLNNGSPGGGGNTNSQTNKPGGNAGANTGGGGGGGSHFNSNNKGGEGGSGIVVIRYTPILNYQFLWSTGDTSATIDVSPSQTTNYYVTISDGVSTCYDTMTVFVNVPVYTFSNDTIANCGVDTASVDAGSGWSKYEWSNGDTSQITSTVQGGIYYLTVTNQYDCSVSDSVSIGIINPSLVQGDTTFCIGDSTDIGFGGGAIGGMTEAGFKLALGLRLINTDYSGEAVQLRRSSDNALSDFGFLNGELDAAAISSWAGTSTIYVRTLYDQSGNSRDVVQTTNSRQPTLVLNSAYGAPIIHFTNSQQLRYTVNYTFQQPFTLVTAAKTTGSSNGRVFGSYHQNWLHGFWQNRINVAYYEGWKVYPGITSSSGWQVPYIHTMWKANQTNWNFYSNATVQSKYNSNAGSDPRGFTLNGYGNLGELSNVDIMEVIMFDDTLAPAELENVQKSVANRFGITTAYGVASAGSVGGGSYEYLWSNGDTTNMINVSPNDTTTYYVTITDGFAECVDSITVNIVDPNFTFSNDTIFSCGADTVGVSAGSTWDNYLWSNGDTTETTSITSSGAYSLTVSNNGQCNTWDTIVVSVINSIVEQGDTTICIGDTATLAIESNGGSSGSTSFSYLWSNSDTTSSINVFPNDTATYFVTITDGFAECYDTITVNVNDPDYSFTNDTVLANCFADSVIVDAGSGWASYNWSAGDTTQTKVCTTTGPYSLTVTDNGGCTSSDTVNVSVINPVLAQGDTMICINTSATVGYNALTNISFLWSNSNTSPSISVSPVVTSNYTVTVSDGISSCFDTIAIYIDTISPTVFPHSNVSVYLNSSGQATLSASLADSATSDNCLIDSIYLSNSSFQCADIGANPTLLYALDNNGNLDSAEFVVSIIDSNAPVAIAQSVTLYLDAAGTANLTVSQVDNGSTDNCAIDTMTLSSYNFVCADTGVNTITLTVSDVSGNSATQSAQITVMDTAAPTVLTQNVTVFLDANGEGTVTAGQVDSSSSDNCAIASMILSDSVFDCSDTVSANNIALSVTDISGNSASSSALITVLDTMSPVAIAQNLTLFLDINGQVTAQASQVDNGSYDNCGVASLILSDSVFTCADSGINNTTLSVFDVSGNSSTATAQLSIIDTISPSVITQNITVYLDSSGQVIISGLDLDSASTDNCAIASRILSDSIFDCSDTGSINIVTLTVTDSSGNSSSNDAQVVIIDSLAPAVITQNVTVYLDTNGEASITVNQIDNGSSDNCAIDTMYLSNDSFDCNSFGLDTIILFVIDASGNVSQDIAIVNVLETTIPTALAQNVTIYLDSAGYASISPLAADSGSYDNCAIETFALSDTTFACADVGENAVVFTVTDYSSNSSSMQITITVLDTIKPVIYAQNPTIYLDANGEASLTISQVDSGSYDNCSIASTLLSDSLFNCDQVGSNDIYFILSDVNGNIDSSIVSVNLLDTIKPTVLAENHQAYLNPDGEFSLDIDAVNASATDNCSVDSIYLEETDFACAHIGINYVSVFAIDENGNIGTISIELEILDTIPPIITYCPADIVSCDSIIDYDTPTALDNCSNLNSLLTAGVESGVRFDIGLTEIQFSFSDTSGNSTTCDFSVKRISSPEITVSRDTTIFNGSAIGLTVQVDSAVDSYYWTPEDYLDDPSSNNPDASPIETTTYRVVVTTNDGCEMEDSVNIIVLNEVVVYNAFSPNNDGQNDYLEINGLDYYPDANVLIVNRAGAKVFESGGYSEPWDGRYKGEEMPVGPYFYFIDTGVSGAEILTGDISLIR
jgi:gliding motility-associated-like protein